MKIQIGDLVAQPGYAPNSWQSAHPSSFGAWNGKEPVKTSPDLTRIKNIQRRQKPEPDSDEAEALIELMTQRYGRNNPHCSCAAMGRECITRLRLTQAWALYEIGITDGLLGPINVGDGKTILDLLAPLAIGSKLALLLVPPNLRDQLITDYRLIAQHFQVPSIEVTGKNFRTTLPGMPVLQVYPYSLLCRPEATDFLDRLAPDTIIADECDKLRYPHTATTGRVLRYFAEHPKTRFCGWSGSITDAGLKEYAHLSFLALRGNSPVPVDPETIDEWGRALDPGDFPAPPGALLDLCNPGEHVRDGFKRRLHDTQGVVTSLKSTVDIPLNIYEKPAPTIPAKVEAALDILREEWIRPDGEELVEALAVSRCAHQLACGFYYRWIFPRGESKEIIDEWFEARREWRKELRTMLKQQLPHLDSPMLCAQAARRAWGEIEGDPNLPHWKAETWPRWKEVKGKVEPETEAVRLDPYLAEDAAAWALENIGIVWYGHTAFGEWVSEIAKLPLHGGGPKAGEIIASETGKNSIVASLMSHGRGRNGLQYKFATQLIANVPSRATSWEQVLGRLHRPGQKASEVSAYFYTHTEELEKYLDTALARAVYVERTIGSQQKLTNGLKQQ